MINKLMKLLVFLGLLSGYAQAQPEYKPLTVEYERNGWKVATGVRVIDSMNYYQPITPEEYYGTYNVDKWGARKDITSQTGATGFFRVEEINGRWYFISPDGTPLIIKGTQYMQPITPSTMGSRMTAAYQNRFNSNPVLWAKETSQLMIDNNFNCLSIWSTSPINWPSEINQTMKRPKCNNYIAQVESINVLQQFFYKAQMPSNTFNKFILLYDDGFLESAESWVDQHTARFKNDPHFVGYYLDNELPFYTAPGSWGYGNKSLTINIEDFLDLQDDLPAGTTDKFKSARINARSAAEQFLTERGKTRATITDDDRFAFIDMIAEKYYSIAAGLVKQYDPDHLVLGSRLHHDSKFLPGVVAACARYSDVISINYYNMWEPDLSYMSNLKTWTSNKPIIITEFYTKGVDAGLPDLTGAGWKVRTQLDRGRFYQNFCMLMLEAKNCAGWTHFSYTDFRELNSAGDDVTANRGIVNQDFEPYTDMLRMMGQFNKNVYKLIDYIDNRP